MSVILHLFISFFKIGIFSFGGGYAMIPLIQAEVINNNWLSQFEFLQIIAVAEMTPGPISINTATYVGYKLSGVMGATVATAGVAAPSLIILTLISKLLFKYYKHPLMIHIFKYIKPAIAGLILAASVKMASISFFKADGLHLINTPEFINNLQIVSIITFGIIVYLAYRLKNKLHPIMYIVITGIIGYASIFFA